MKRATCAALLFDELIVDNFAGGGGASLGIELAMGRAVDIAINHDAQAVALHRANHPHTIHLHSDVWEVDPVEVTRGKPVGLAWFSPDCKHFSRAKGGKPVEKRIRGLAWVVTKWAAKVKPRVIMLENVREFETWGPLGTNNLPCPRRRGRTFKRWVGILRGLGYDIEKRVLDAADFGAPTHRKRLFIIARCDGEPIRWPEPTHGPGRRKPYRTAAECIDWSLPCPSIFLTREEGRRIGVIRPLAEKTMRRIAMGLKRFVLENPKPFIVRVAHGESRWGSGSHDLGDPLPTQTGTKDFALVVPSIVGCGGPEFSGEATSAGEPLRTVMPRNCRAVVAPYLVAQFGEREGQAPRAHRADKPMPTVTPRDGGGFPLIAPTLLQYNQEKGNETRGLELDRPINTVVSENRFALVAAFLAKHYGGVVGHLPERPLGTITGIDHHSVVATYITRQNFGDKPCDAIDEPLRTITAQGNHHTLTQAFLTKFYGTNLTGQTPTDPLHAVTAKDRFGLVMIDGAPHVIADIGLRMLAPRELYRAQGFPDDYRIEIPFMGKTLSRAAQVKMCGNSVCPQVAEALVLANFPDEIQIRPRRRRRDVAV